MLSPAAATDRIATGPALETIELRKEYGDKVVVENLTLRVERGEVFGYVMSG